ncbi:MAG: biopolymer transporter ExbD [Flavobacteriaceae bacterium]|nr:biopolymer transporter ExbD [Flavobacteriaceae bacterium]
MNLRGRNKISPEFSMSSMTDIVFLLLVFFLLTSPAITPQALDLVLPKSSAKTSKNQDISVSITKNLEFYINKDRISENNLENSLKNLLANKPDQTIVLRAEQGVPIEKATFVMDIAYRNKYNIVLAVKPD